MPGKTDTTDTRSQAQDIEPAANTGEVIIRPGVRVFRRAPTPVPFVHGLHLVEVTS